MGPREIVLCCALVCSGTPGDLRAGEPLEPAKQHALAELEGLAGEIGAVSLDLWALSETALREERSAERLIEVLAVEGFAIERGSADLPTAFVATWGSGRPIVGILAEYDALPGVGNAATPERAAREDGVTSGHGCGHNLFGAASVYAAVAVKRVLEGQESP